MSEADLDLPASGGQHHSSSFKDRTKFSDRSDKNQHLLLSKTCRRLLHRCRSHPDKNNIVHVGKIFLVEGRRQQGLSSLSPWAGHSLTFPSLVQVTAKDNMKEICPSK